MRSFKKGRLAALRMLAVAALVAGSLPLQAPRSAVAAPEIVSATHHVRLGYRVESPFAAHFGDDIVVASYSLDVNGTMSTTVDLGADVQISYDRSLVVPGATVPISITYTPTNDTGREISVDVSADVTLDCSVIGIDACVGSLNDLTLLSGGADGLAPLTGDPALSAPLSSDTLTLNIAGFDAARAQVTGSLTAAHAPGTFPPGLGGAAAVVGVTGGTLTGALGLVPVLEWQTAGQTLVANVQVGETGTVALTLQPVMHWLDTAASAQVNIDLLGLLDDVFGDPSPISIMSGSLGDEYQSAGLDVLIGGAVGEPAGPFVAARVADGFIPAALTNPAIATVPPAPTLGSIGLTIDTDADDDGLPDGIELTGANPTDPDNPDSDGDGLLDGAEDANHNGALDAGETNPNDADSDDDALSDGTEVNGANPTNPLDADSDDDGLSDGAEDANHNGAIDTGETNPNDADSDDDGLMDGVEVEVGTDPLDSDSDDDGILDGEDADFLISAIADMDVSAFRAAGNQVSMISILEASQARVASGNVAQAIRELEILRTRVDGCGTVADQNDWVPACADQTSIREFIDLLISNLGA